MRPPPREILDSDQKNYLIVHMNELVGQRIDRYRIEALIGQGGMAAVYRAIDLNLKRRVALKVVHPHLAQQPQFQQRFMREAQTAAQLSHPGVIAIDRVGSDQGFFFLSMELLLEGTLGDYIRRWQESNRLNHPRRAIMIVAQVADALAYAHRQGVVHGDIKPDNILLKLLDRPDHSDELPIQAIVTDFGLATLLQEQAEETAPDLFMGSLPYMSPEQCMAKKLDGRSDLYSLGVVLFQLVTGQLPFDVKLPTEAVIKHLKAPPPRPSLIRSDLPQGTEAIILKALAKNPADRFQTGDEMAQALRHVAGAVAEQPGVSPSPPQSEDDAPPSPGEDDGALTKLTEREWSGAPVQIPAAQIEAGEQDQIIMAREGDTVIAHVLDKNIISIGRSRQNDIVLSAIGVSRRHARMEKSSQGWQIVDLDSTNGTFLDGNRLLPDILETWSDEQTVRIGDFFLQWRKGKRRASEEALGVPPGMAAETAGAAEESDIHRTEQLSARVTPTEASVAPGSQVEIEIALLNQGGTVGHFQIQAEGLPDAWVTLPEESSQLLPGERGTSFVIIRPPQDSSATAGHHPYQLVVTDAARGDREMMRVPCGLEVAPFERFTADMQPKILRNRGTCRVLIGNEGNFETTYSVIGRDDGEAIHFIDPRQERARAISARRPPAMPAGGKKLLNLPIIRRLPFARDLARAKREAARWGKLVPSDRQATAPPPQAARLGTFHTRVKVAAGEQNTVDLAVEPKKRPFLARSQQTHAFQVQVGTATAGQPQSLPGQLEVNPIIPPWLPPLLLLLLFAGAVLYALFADPDEDGLVNAEEIAIGTDPQEPDTDRDGRTDGEEVIAETDPIDPASVETPLPATPAETPELSSTPVITPAPPATPTPPVSPTPAIIPTLIIIPSPTPIPTSTPPPPTVGAGPPAAAADSFAAIEDAPLNSAPQSVLDNDSGADGVGLTAVLDAKPAHGTLALNADGVFLYTPDENFNGADSFSYHASDGSARSDTVTVIISVAPANDPPEAVADRFSMDENTTLNTSPLSILDNDADIDGDTLTAVLDNGPENGIVILNGDGTFTYTPNPNFFGSDTFTYHANDGATNSNTTTVIITIGEDNDAPAAVNDEFSTNEDVSLNDAALNVLSNDTDPEGDSLTAVLANGPTDGALTLRPDGTFVYAPRDDFSGADSFTYFARDGAQNSNTATVIITVVPVDDPPVAVVDRYRTDEDTTLDSAGSGQPGVLDNDQDVDSSLLTAVLDRGPENGALATFNEDSGAFIYTPNADFFGTDTFTYHVNDGTSNSIPTTVIITISGENDAPRDIVLSNNSVSENQPGGFVVGSFTAIDPDSGVHTFSLVAGAGAGGNNAFAISGNTLQTNAILDFETQSSYSIRVRASDSDGDFFEKPFTINVLGVNEPPLISSMPITQADVLKPYTYNITITDPDAGDSLTITSVLKPSWLILTDNGNGTAVLNGTPDCGDVGDHDVTLQVQDAAKEKDIQSFTITVPNTCSTLIPGPDV